MVTRFHSLSLVALVIAWHRAWLAVLTREVLPDLLQFLYLQLVDVAGIDLENMPSVWVLHDFEELFLLGRELGLAISESLLLPAALVEVFQGFGSLVNVLVVLLMPLSVLLIFSRTFQYGLTHLFVNEVVQIFVVEVKFNLLLLALLLGWLVFVDVHVIHYLPLDAHLQHLRCKLYGPLIGMLGLEQGIQILQALIALVLGPS